MLGFTESLPKCVSILWRTRPCFPMMIMTDDRHKPIIGALQCFVVAGQCFPTFIYIYWYGLKAGLSLSKSQALAWISPLKDIEWTKCGSHAFMALYYCYSRL